MYIVQLPFGSYAPVMKSGARGIVLALLSLLLIATPMFVFAPRAYADTSLDKIMSDLGISDPDQYNLFGATFARLTDPVGCENDLLDVMGSHRVSNDIFISCHEQLNSILRLSNPQLMIKVNVPNTPPLYVPFELGADPYVGIIKGVYTSDVARSLLKEIDSGANVRMCGGYVAFMLEAASIPVVDAAAIAGAEVVLPASLIGATIACGSVLPDIMHLIAPLAVWVHHHR